MQKYERVLELMKSKGGTIAVDDPELVDLLKSDRGARGEVLYRLPTYISFIRRFAHIDVKGKRQGRKVVAYELVAMAPADSAPATSEPTTDEQPV